MKVRCGLSIRKSVLSVSKSFDSAALSSVDDTSFGGLFFISTISDFRKGAGTCVVDLICGGAAGGGGGGVACKKVLECRDDSVCSFVILREDDNISSSFFPPLKVRFFFFLRFSIGTLSSLILISL